MDKPTQRKAAYRLFTTKRVSFSAVQAPFYDPRVLNTAQSVCWISNLNAPRLHSINLIPTTDTSADQLTCERKDNVDRNPQPHFGQELLLSTKINWWIRTIASISIIEDIKSTKASDRISIYELCSSYKANFG